MRTPGNAAIIWKLPALLKQVDEAALAVAESDTWENRIPLAERYISLSMNQDLLSKVILQMITPFFSQIGIIPTKKKMDLMVEKLFPIIQKRGLDTGK